MSANAENSVLINLVKQLVKSEGLTTSEYVCRLIIEDLQSRDLLTTELKRRLREEELVVLLFERKEYEQLQAMLEEIHQTLKEIVHK